jgi:hypothetical protein
MREVPVSTIARHAARWRLHPLMSSPRTMKALNLTIQYVWEITGSYRRGPMNFDESISPNKKQNKEMWTLIQFNILAKWEVALLRCVLDVPK